MKKSILLIILMIAGYSPFAFCAQQPLSMDGCKQLVAEMKKQFPARIDAMTVRTGAKCETGKTKPSMLVLLDSIDSQTSADDWKVALSSEEGQAKLTKLMCSTQGYTKFLPLMDLGQRLSINGEVIGTISATEKKCSALR